MKTKLTYGFVGVIALALGCSYESTRTSNYDVSFSSTSFSSSPTSPSRSQGNEITLSNVSSSDIAYLEGTLDATNKALTRIEDEITTAETAIANASQQQSLLPTQIEQLRLTVARLSKSINEAKVEVVTAERNYTEFAATIADRKATTKQLVAASLRHEYEQTVANIRLARQNRDELRVRIGASPEVQSEAQLQSLRTRQARDHAQQTYVATLQREYNTIDAEAASLASRISSAKKQLHLLNEGLDSNERLIQNKSEELIVAGVTVASLPIKLARLQKDQRQLIKVQLVQSNDLRLARTALQKKDELLAEQKRQRELERQRSTTLVASSQPSAPNFTSTRSNDSVKPTYISSASSVSRPTTGYYNYYYRPPVGNHYVRGHTRNDGTYVSGHRRTDADDSFWNNWSSHGNINPYTGRQGTKLPSYSYGGGSTYVRGHIRSNGTYVSGHYRRN